MSIQIKMMTLGMVSTNSYLISDTDSKQAVLIDPVDNAPYLYEVLQETGCELAFVLATHAHFDHILASKALKELTGAPFYIHEDCVPMLKALPMQGRMFGMGEFPEAATPDRLLTTAPETLTAGAIQLETRHTPGHADGHLAFYMPNERVIFSGDTLFAGSIGRTDLPNGNLDVLMHAINTQLLTLDDDVQVLAGHMGITTIGMERRTNPFIVGM